MTGGREIELKYGVDADRVDAVGAALGAARAKSMSLESRYFDTADGRLAKAGLALRLRRSGRRWEQTLKGQDVGNVWDRSEDTAARAVPRAGLAPAIEPALHQASKAGRRMLDVLEDDGILAPLAERHRSVIARQTLEVRASDARVEVALDTGHVVAAGEKAPVSEVEYELLEGNPIELVAIARGGVVEHGLWLSTTPKSARGERLAGAPVSACKSIQPQLKRGDDGGAIVRKVVAACFAQIAANQSAIADGLRDDEFVHQLRVGLRRMRTAARELASFDAAIEGPWLEAVVDAFRTLGADRDRRVVASVLARRLADAGSPLPDLAVVAPAAVEPVAVVRSSAFQLALLDLLELQWSSPSSAACSATEAHQRIGKRLDRLHRRLARAAKRFGKSLPEEQHRIRKQLKRLRYLAELVGSLYGRSAVKRYLAQLKPAQDALGEHVDLLTGRQYAQVAVDAGREGAWFNVAWIDERLVESSQACASALERASRSKTFW